ncbi:hypothetical protein ZWY2020_007803 [Hordeum vulgare]|nr:hypothetical protein ZWY2020_007803 [Hordeum vulgare]
MEMAMLPGYQRLSTTCDATFADDDDSVDYGAWSWACLPQAARILGGVLTRVVSRWRGEGQESASAPALAPASRNERRRLSWWPDPDDRWPVQGWC